MYYVLLYPQGTVKEYPYTLHQLRMDNPLASFGDGMSDEGLAAWNVYRVLPNSAPTVSYTQDVTEVLPTIQDGQWVQTWEVTPASAETVAQRISDEWKAVRSERNTRLSACDWTQLADTTVNSAVWAAYRQALRDLPQSQADPFNIVWPVPPG